MKARYMTAAMALALALLVQSAHAIEPGVPPQYPAGVTSGIPTGTILPATFYVDFYTNYYDARVVDASGKKTGINIDVFANVPQIHFAPDWTILGGKFQAIAQIPFVDIRVSGLVHAANSGVDNPYLSPFNLAWTLAPGTFFSIGEGIYLPEGDKAVRDNFTTYEQSLAFSYLNNGWDVTAHALFDFNEADKTTNYKSGNIFSLDFTATKNIGGLDIGPIAYYQNQTTNDRNDGFAYGPARPTFGRIKAVGLGALVSYRFGPLIARASITSDVYARSTTQGTHYWLSLTLPLTPIRARPNSNTSD